MNDATKRQFSDNVACGSVGDLFVEGIKQIIGTVVIL